LEIQGRRVLLILYPNGDAVVEVAFDDSWTIGGGYLGRFNRGLWCVEDVEVPAEFRRELGQLLAWARRSPEVVAWVAENLCGWGGDGGTGTPGQGMGETAP